MLTTPYTFTQNDIDEFMARSVIKIDKDKVTIDGVEYTDIWLSTDAAEKFRVNAFDIENAFDISSQTEGTFVSGVGKWAGIPIFSVDGIKRSQNHIIPGEEGSYSAGTGGTYTITGKDNERRDWFIKGYGLNSEIDHKYPPVSWDYYYRVSDDGYCTLYYKRDTGTTYNTRQIGAKSYYENEPFDFDWVAGTIPVDQPLTNEGLRIRVPTQEINQWYVDNPSFGPNITIDMGVPELSTKIDDLMDLIIPLIPILDIDFNKYEDPTPVPIPEPIPEPDPYPDPDPEPGTVLPDIDWTDLF